MTTTRTSSAESKHKRVDLAAPKAQVVGQTKNGKDIEIARSRCGMFFSIRFVGGGQLPDELSGLFTSHELAKSAIAQYRHDKGLD